MPLRMQVHVSDYGAKALSLNRVYGFVIGPDGGTTQKPRSLALRGLGRQSER